MTGSPLKQNGREDGRSAIVVDVGPAPEPAQLRPGRRGLCRPPPQGLNAVFRLPERPGLTEFFYTVKFH